MRKIGYVVVIAWETKPLGPSYHLALKGQSKTLCNKEVSRISKNYFNPKDDCQLCRIIQERRA